MAYNADIIVRLVETEVDKAVKSIERKLDRLQSSASDIQIGAVTKGTKELRGFEKRVDAIGRSLERIKPTATIGAIGTAFAAGAGGVEKFAQALQGVNNLGSGFGKVAAAVNSFGSSVEQALGPTGKFGAALLDFISSAPATAAGIGLATASVVAFAPAIKQATADVFNFKKNFQNLVTSITSGGLVAFDSLNQKFEITRKGLIELAKGAGSLSFLKEELREAKRSLAEMDSTADEFRQETERLIEAERNVNNELRARQRIYDELTAQQRQVRENVEASRASRAGTGFGASDPVAKSIRRNQQKVAREKARLEKLSAIEPGPLALPSSDMLKAAERGIKNLKAVTNQLGEELDYSNQEVANFINGLKKGANEAVKLPKIFDIVNSSLKEAVASTEKLKSPTFGPGNDKGIATYKERVRLTKLANNLDLTFTKSINSLKVKQNAALYRLEQRRIKKLADQQKAADRQRNKRLESIALGVGFPALFGGGAGSILGSAAGSFVGSGFGGQILGGAVGQAIDQYVQGLTSLANSLESTTGILDGLEEAGFKVSAATRSVIESYQQAGLEAEAYELAIAEINRVLGPDGASKLSDYRIANEELQSVFQEAKAALDSELLPALTGTIRLILGLKEAFDTIAASPLFKLIGGFNNLTLKALPGLGSASDAFGFLQDVGAPSGEVVVPEAQRLAQEDAKLKKLTEQTREITKQGAAQAKSDDATRRQNEALKEQIKIQKAGTDIKDESVFLARKDAIELKANNALIDAGTNFEAKRNAELTRELELLKLRNQRNAAFTRESEKANRENERATEIQRRILQASENAVQVEQNKLNLARAEGAAAKALVQFAIKKTQIEQQYQKLVEQAQKIGGPSEQETLENLDKAQGLALSENQLRLDNEINKIAEDSLKPLKEKIQAYKDQITFNEKYRDLIKDGVNPELAKELLNIDLIADKQLEALELEQKRALEIAVQNEDLEKQKEIMERLNETRGQIEQKRTQAKAAATAADGAQPGKVQAYVDQLQQELDDTQGMIVSLAQTVENEIGSAMSSAITGVITGTQTVEEAMSTMFANIGKAFIDMATQMIAKALVMKALGILFPGSGSEGMSAAQAAGWPTARPLATGGPTRPNGTYLVGEQGPELLTMGNQSGYVHRNTSEAMDRYRAGGSSNGGSGSLNVNYNVTQINGMNFVTEEQFRAGMTQAAKDGARMGEAGTFKTMRNSRSNRARVGL